MGRLASDPDPDPDPDVTPADASGEPFLIADPSPPILD
jgi:hypothetical protein